MSKSDKIILSGLAVTAFISIFSCRHALKKREGGLPEQGYKTEDPLAGKKILFKDTAPIFNNKCVGCHSAGRTLIKFHDYESVYGRRAMIQYVIEKGLMPPWFVAPNTGPYENDFSLTDLEKKTLLKWLNDGLPYKNRNIKLIPPPAKRKTITAPDYVIKSDTPIEIPSDGFIPYKKVISAPAFTEDKWIKEIEFVIKPQVVHHLFLYSIDKKHLPEITSESEFHPAEKRVTAWSVGTERHKTTGKRTGIKVPQNSAFLLRIHYEATGKKVTDFETAVKLKFHPKKPKYSTLSLKLDDPQINIPPHTDNYVSETRHKIKQDRYLVRVGAHMHLRGKKTSVFLIEPGGSKRLIFGLNPYYFNSRTGFNFRKPLFIPKGSVLVCQNHFDNSPNNPVNPDPSKRVRWSFFTYEGEMSQCYFRFIIQNF